MKAIVNEREVTFKELQEAKEPYFLKDCALVEFGRRSGKVDFFFMLGQSKTSRRQKTSPFGARKQKKSCSTLKATRLDSRIMVSSPT